MIEPLTLRLLIDSDADVVVVVTWQCGSQVRVCHESQGLAPARLNPGSRLSVYMYTPDSVYHPYDGVECYKAWVRSAGSLPIQVQCNGIIPPSRDLRRNRLACTDRYVGGILGPQAA